VGIVGGRESLNSRSMLRDKTNAEARRGREKQLVGDLHRDDTIRMTLVPFLALLSIQGPLVSRATVSESGILFEAPSFPRAVTIVSESSAGIQTVCVYDEAGSLLERTALPKGSRVLGTNTSGNLLYLTLVEDKKSGTYKPVQAGTSWAPDRIVKSTRSVTLFDSLAVLSFDDSAPRCIRMEWKERIVLGGPKEGVALVTFDSPQMRIRLIRSASGSIEEIRPHLEGGRSIQGHPSHQSAAWMESNSIMAICDVPRGGTFSLAALPKVGDLKPASPEEELDQYLLVKITLSTGVAEPLCLVSTSVFSQGLTGIGAGKLLASGNTAFHLVGRTLYRLQFR
jgi:hypothetical protein